MNSVCVCVLVLGASVVVDHTAHIKRELDGQATVAIANPTLLTSSSSPRGPPTSTTTTAMASPRGSNSSSNGGHVSAAEGAGGGGGVGKRKGATPSFKLAPPPEPEPEPALAGFDLRQIPKVTTPHLLNHTCRHARTHAGMHRSGSSSSQQHQPAAPAAVVPLCLLCLFCSGLAHADYWLAPASHHVALHCVPPGWLGG